MPPKRMTANPVRPARYRAGKPTGAQDSASSDSEADSADGSKKPAPRKIAPPPKAPSAGKIISTGAKGRIDFKSEEEARRIAAAKARAEAERKAREEGFVTEDEEDEGEEGSGDGSEESEEESEDEESSDEEEAPRRLMMRPKFIPKSARGGDSGEAEATVSAEDAERAAEAEEARRRAAADAMVEEQIRKDLAARAAGKKHWEDSDEEDEVDDTDGVDPEAEYAAWKLRELKRIRRDREAIEEREREREEIERRRNLTEEERKAEDEEFLAKQRDEKEGRGKMAYLQKYFHKGAFYQDESHAEGLDKRDIMGARFADDVKNRELLPQALQMRDMTKLGKKGATKYRDLKSEDTGRWGELDSGRPRRAFDRGVDERFQPDHDMDRSGREGATKANAIPLGERKVVVPGAPEGPRGDRGDRYRDRDAVKGGDSGSYRPRDDDRHRRRSRSRSRSRSPRRDRRDRDRSRDRGDYRERRKRESSRDHDRYESDKRRRVDAR